MSNEENPQEILPSNESVLNKYMVAGDIAKEVLRLIISKCIDKASVRELCKFGDSQIIELTQKTFNKQKNIKKGIAFPTCISCNDCVCHFSPLESDPDYIISNGDVVKIDLAVHIDGYIGSLAHTLVVGATKDSPTTGVKADLMAAAYYAVESCLRLMKDGNSSQILSDNVKKIYDCYNCKGMEDMISFEISKHDMDGGKKIIFCQSDISKKDYKNIEFKNYETYTIDIFVTNSANPTSSQKDTRTTVFKKTKDPYNVKLKSSKELLKELGKICDTMPFSLRMLTSESKARMGIKECIEHNVVLPFQVLYVKNGDLVVHLKFTAVITPKGAIRTTPDVWDCLLYKTDKTINDELVELLKQPIRQKN